MDKNEYRIKTEQMLEYMKKKSYKKALEIADSIEWRKVKNAAMLCAASEVYEYNRQYQKSREILFEAYDRSPGSRKIVYRLGTLALKLDDTNEATDCYEEFIAMAPKDPNQYILRYKILKKQGASVEQRIHALEDFKKAEYVEKWAYELAMLYHEAGMVAECLEECDDLILWFSDGKYVRQAMELKMQYKPLTPLQQEKYLHGSGEVNIQEVVETPVEESVEEAVQAEEPVVETEPEVVEEVEEAAEAAEAAEEEAAEEAEVAEEVAEEAEAAEEAEESAEEAEATEEAEESVEEAEAAEEVEEVAEESETVEEEETVEAAPVPSIEEILQGWEAQQKENAQMIQAEKEKAEFERAEREAEKKEMDIDSILPDDIRQLMEELEAEASEIEAKKARLRDVAAQKAMHQEPEVQPVAEEEAVEESVQFEEPTSTVEEVAVKEMSVAEMLVEEPEEQEEEEFFEEESFEEPVADNFEEIEEIEEEDAGIKLGNTQAIAISAKALMNDILMEEEPKELPKKTAPTSPFDTGFIVQGRYDLDVQSEIGIKAGLTEEQKKLFSYFVPVHGMSEQIVDVLQHDKECRTRYGTSRTANILIVGRKGSGKTVLAVDIVKAIQKERKLKQGKVGIVTAESLNKKDVAQIVGKLHGGALIIERAAKLNKKTIAELNELMEEQTEEMLVVLEEERRPLDKMLSAHPTFKKKFTSRLELPVFINDELVTFGQTYAKENGFKIDDMGILALYSRIDLMQREESVVTVADVKEIIDDAIEKSQRTNLKKFFMKMFKKNTDETSRVILTEQDFK